LLTLGEFVDGEHPNKTKKHENIPKVLEKTLTRIPLKDIKLPKQVLFTYKVIILVIPQLLSMFFQ